MIPLPEAFMMFDKQAETFSKNRAMNQLRGQAPDRGVDRPNQTLRTPAHPFWGAR
jgi:hypothetical protein